MKANKILLTSLKILICIVLLISFGLVESGFRFSASSAAQCIRFTQPVQRLFLLEQPVNTDLVFHLLDIGDAYYTVYSRKYGPLWKSYLGVGSYRKKIEDNKIDLLTEFWDSNAGVGWLISTSHDPNIAYFNIKRGDAIITQEALFSEPTVIIVSSSNDYFSNMNLGFTAIALSRDSEPIYELSYPIINNTVYVEEYGWYPYTEGYGWYPQKFQ